LKIQIRNARKEDAYFLAKVMLIAGRAHVEKGIWEVILGGTEKECVNFLRLTSITQIPHLFHYSNCLIAEEEGISIGGLGAYDPKENGYQSLQKALPEVVQKLNFPEHAFNDSAARSLKILACLPQEIDGAWVIDSVATLPGYRGRGVARSLLKIIMELGKKQGHTKAQVNMYIGNESALNLYLSLGFEIIEEKRDGFFAENIGAPGMLSLARDL